jgi:hypothetical protein
MNKNEVLDTIMEFSDQKENLQNGTFNSMDRVTFSYDALLALCEQFKTSESPDSKGNASAEEQEEIAVEVFEWLTGNNAKENPKAIDAIQRRFTITKKQ